MTARIAATQTHARKLYTRVSRHTRESRRLLCIFTHTVSVSHTHTYTRRRHTRESCIRAVSRRTQKSHKCVHLAVIHEKVVYVCRLGLSPLRRYTPESCIRAFSRHARESRMCLQTRLIAASLLVQLSHEKVAHAHLLDTHEKVVRDLRWCVTYACRRYPDTYEKVICAYSVDTHKKVVYDSAYCRCADTHEKVVYAYSVDTHDKSRVWLRVLRHTRERCTCVFSRHARQKSCVTARIVATQTHTRKVYTRIQWTHMRKSYIHVYIHTYSLSLSHTYIHMQQTHTRKLWTHPCTNTYSFSHTHAHIHTRKRTHILFSKIEVISAFSTETSRTRNSAPRLQHTHTHWECSPYY